MSIFAGFGTFFTHITGMIDSGAHGAAGDLHSTYVHSTKLMVNPFIPTNDPAGTSGGNLPIHIQSSVNTTQNTLPDGINKLIIMHKKPKS